MKNVVSFSVFRTVLCFVFVLFGIISFAQAQTTAPKSKSDFWQRVQFGGGIGLNIGSGFTDVTLAPSGIYNINEYVSAGVGLQGSYVSSKNYFTSAVYGGSLIGLFNPIEEVQLSAELEELRVNRTVDAVGGPNIKDNFWNTALFIGAGYRSQNVTIGVRYNVLYNPNIYVYSEAFMPFARIYF